jgi:hypothetical protein
MHTYIQSAIQGDRGLEMLAENADVISETLASLGPTYSKFGQVCTMYACMYVCTYVCMHIFLCNMHAYICIYTHLFV